MLSPRYLAGLSEELVEIYSQLETDILCDMARRLSRVGKITEMTEYQARTLVEAGLLKQNIARVLKNYDKRIVEELTAIFSDAMIKNVRADNRIFKEETGRTLSDSQTQVMLASIKKVHSDLSRLTLTTAETGNYQFIRIANRAYMNVASGAFNYNSAIKQATDELAKEGLHTRVTYSNQGKKPVTRSIEAAVRMNVLTGVNQTAAAVSLTNCDELGCDLVEVTAHLGARPSHEAWQGKIYKLHGSTDKYPNFYEVCRYGEADGICGVNCRHSFYPYFEGQEKHYTQDDLDELSAQKVSYNGEEISRYEGEQKLRHIERNIRFYKKKAAIDEAAGLDNTKARLKIGEWQAKARDFTTQTGIMRDSPRERIGMKDGAKQPRGVLHRKTDSFVSTLETKTQAKAVKMFPDEKWENVSENVFVSEIRKRVPNRIEKLKLEKEISQAKILAKHGHTVYLVPEIGDGKQFDTITDGVKTEFKYISGNRNTLGREYKKAIKQADSVFLQTSGISKEDIYSKIIGETKTLLENNIILKEFGYVYLWLDDDEKLYTWKMSNIVKTAKNIMKK